MGFKYRSDIFFKLGSGLRNNIKGDRSGVISSELLTNEKVGFGII